MKLLIVTQRVDSNDPILGFFTRWIQEFAKHTDKLTIVAQVVEEAPLPPGVTALSIGKDRKQAKWKQILTFWRILVAKKQDYDAVLVHMTPIWVVLGWPIFRLLKKPVYLWYEARGTRWPFKLSLKIVEKVFSASPYGMPVQTPKSVIVGHGIDVEAFKPADEPRDEKLLITVGRISRTKRLPVMLQCLVEFGDEYRLIIGGSALTDDDGEILRDVQRFMQQHQIADRVQLGFLSKSQVLSLYRTAGIFVHASNSGLDKTILEAMSCECLVVSCSPAMENILPPECRALDDTMHAVAAALLRLPASKKNGLRKMLSAMVRENHNLEHLIPRLVLEMGG